MYRGFHNRIELGMRSPKSRSKNIRPQDGGVAVHWGGPGNAPTDHARCKERWLAWQVFHMSAPPQGRGWVDIAYSYGFCNHGYVFAGRGYGVRTAAQGTNDGNDRFLAACWIGGNKSIPSVDAYDALDWIVRESRKLGAGRAVREHGYFHSTACPGRELEGYAKVLHNHDIGPIPTPSKQPTDKPRPIPIPPAPKPVPLPEDETTMLAYVLPKSNNDTRAWVFAGNELRHISGTEVKAVREAGGTVRFVEVPGPDPLWDYLPETEAPAPAPK